MQHPAPAFVGTNMKMGLQRATGGRGLSASGIQVRQLRSRLTISTLQCSLQCSPAVNTPKVFALAAFEFRRQGKKGEGLTEANKALQVQVKAHERDSVPAMSPSAFCSLLAHVLQPCFSDAAA